MGACLSSKKTHKDKNKR